MAPQSKARPFTRHDPETLSTIDVLGMPVAQIRLPHLLAYIRSAVRNRTHTGNPRLIAYANAHTCNLFIEDPVYMRAMLHTDLIYADGNGPRFAAWLSGSSLPPRMTGADWIYDLCRLCMQEGFRLYFLGGSPGVAEAAARRLRGRFPDLRIVGIRHGFFSAGEEGQVLQAVQQTKPDILVLGMGSPRQEIWMVERKNELVVPVIWGAGGVFDYVSGTLPRAPAWMRRLALEWLGRMLIEPRRLALRYLTGIPVFTARVVRQALARRLSHLRH